MHLPTGENLLLLREEGVYFMIFQSSKLSTVALMGDQMLSSLL